MASDAGLDGKESSEQRAFLKSAAKRLYEFLDEGGEVDIVLTKDGGDDEDEEGIAGRREALKEDLRKLRQLESEIKRLAHDDSSIDEADEESEDDADSD